MRWHHAHIYFKLEQADLAGQVRQDIARAVPGLAYIGPLIAKPIGPHPLPMFEIHIAAEQLAAAMTALEAVRQGLSVLIHPVQPDEIAAHTLQAQWLGKPLVLDIAFLKQWQQARDDKPAAR